MGEQVRDRRFVETMLLAGVVAHGVTPVSIDASPFPPPWPDDDDYPNTPPWL